MGRNKGQGSLTSRYLAALLAPAVIAGVMQVTWPLFQHNPVSPYLLAVIFCAWYGGLGPGPLSVVISLLLTNFFFIEPYFSFSTRKQIDLVSLLLFAVVGSFISAMSGLRHRQTRRAVSDISGTSIGIRRTVPAATEPKYAEDALRETERKYRSIFENAVEGIFQSTPDGKFIAANPALARMLGFDSPEELISTRTNIAREHYVDPKSREEFKRSLEENGFVLDFEHEAFRKDGSKIWLSENVRAVRDSSGTVVYYEGTTQDIIGRKRAEEALRESEERYRDLVESSLDLICTHDLNGLILSANRAATKILGYGSESYTGGTNLREILPPEVRDQFDDYVKRIRADGVASGSMLVQTLTGEKRIWEYHNTLRTQGVSAPIVRGMARDITEQKRAEELLRQSERQLAEAQRTAHLGSWSWDLNSEAQIWSDELYRIYGLQPGKVAATSEAFLDLLHPEDRLLFGESVERASRTEKPFDFYLRIIRPDGEERVIHSRGRILYDDQGTAIRRSGTAQDVTEYRRAEEAVRAAEQKYRDIFENAVEGIFQTTADGRFVSANPALVKMLGFSSLEELIRERADVSNQHYVDPKCHEELKRRLDEQGVVRGFEYQGYRKDGSTIWLSENVRTVRDEGGEVLYYEGTTQDITEGRRANHRLRLFRTLIDRSSDAIEVIDPNTLRFLDCNESAYHDLGYSREEFLSLSVSDIDPLLDERMAARHIEEMDASGFVIFESIHRRKDGSTFPVEINLKIVRLERDYRLAVVRDTTERKLGEEALRESEERYRELFENAKDAIYVQDLGGVYISVNRAAEKLSGYDRKEIIGKHFDQFVAPEYLPLVCANLAKKLQNGEQTAYEIEVIARGGRRVPVELSSGVIFKHGVPVGIQGMARDITKRKRAEDDLRQQKEILQTIFDHIPVMIRLAGPDGDIQLVNREYERTTGWSLEEIQKEPLKIFAELYPDKHERQLILELIARATGEWADFRTRARDGRVIDTSWANIRLSAGMSLGIGQDISERKRAEETLRSYPRQLIEAQEAERQHIARELHDQVGQMLTAVRINLQTIWNSCETPESRSLIHQGFATIDAALEQVRNLSFELRPSLLDDLGLVAALRWYSDQYTQRTGIQARSVTNLPGGGTRLRQELETACFRIVQEALTNVVRHANAKNVSISLRRLDQKIVLSIKDDGIGFDKLSPNGGASAIRLGLTGMKERTLALGGTLEIESAPAQGTEIRAWFPTSSNED